MKITKQGIAVIEGDNCISKWVESERRLDHDQNMLPRVLKHIKPGDWVIDCGAFIGDHTVAYSKAVGKEGEVFAFEPNEVAYDCLRFNMTKYPNVSCFRQGLGKETTRAGIKQVEGNAGMAYLSKGDEISITSIDELEFPQLDFIKVDCEGYELEVLEGAVKTIERFKPKMLIEINQTTLERLGISKNDVFKKLDNMGYKYENIYPSQGLNESQMDIICWHDSQSK